MNIFISWSKHKSEELAKATQTFLKSVLLNYVDCFRSPEMYKGTCVDNEIHQQLLRSDMCIVCLTAENYKNPWLMYEAGVVYGANYAKGNTKIVVPILFEPIPEWSSWIDKPLNRYVPIKMQNSCGKIIGKKDFLDFIRQICDELKIEVSNIESSWRNYEKKVLSILEKEQLIPTECKDLVDKLMKHSDGFTQNSPEFTKDSIYFHKGFTTHTLTKILTENLSKHQGKYLWFWGRKNHNLIMSREYEAFFEYLTTEGLANGVDFRCLFVHPKSNAADKASSKDRSKIFNAEMQNILITSYNLKAKFGLPIEKLFRLYTEPRTESIIRVDNSVLYRNIIRDEEGYPLPYTNSGFEVMSTLKNNSKGHDKIEKFLSVWDDDCKSVPLSADLLKKIYGNIIN